MKFGFNEQGEIQIEGYLEPRDGSVFTSDELNTAYLLASSESSALAEDGKAKQLLQEFVAPNANNPQKLGNKRTYQVFTFDERVPEHSGLRPVQPPNEKARKAKTNRGKHTTDPKVRCVCCQSIDWISPLEETTLPGDIKEPDPSEPSSESVNLQEIVEEECECCGPPGWATHPDNDDNAGDGSPKSVFAGKKYKPVALKVRPVYGELPEKYRIKREITGNPLADMPGLSTNPGDFSPTGRYTAERKEIIDKIHEGDFLWLEERKLMHHFMMLQEQAFAWDDSERGSFRHDFFPPVEVPVVEHKVWVEKSIPIPRGQLEQVCRIIKNKIDAGVYEHSNSSYRTKFFGVIKKDGKSIRLVHSLEPLNAVTIAHSGIPPATEELANHFAGRACGAVLDLYSGYDHRDLAESSRDFTTFQTPFGALRLVKLPQGWTNSVPIFHDDVTFILKDEIPHITIPYIDDVPVRGPGSRYIQADGTYETIPENTGIRRFIWEHFQNLNRVIQRLKYCGGTVSGLKALLCLETFPVVGHMCSYEGRRPSEDRIGVIERWPPLENVSEVRQFLGVVGTMRMFIKDYTVMTRPLTRLLRADVEWEWSDMQVASMEAIKYAVRHCDALKPINYDWDSDVVMAVDTSWMAVGLEIYQVDPEDPKKRYYAKFDSIPLNAREARFSQPKRELYGLLRALLHMQYWLLGCRRLVIETDAMYIKGMLSNPGMGPNATINRWIEQILMFHFQLKHVKGLTFSPDGLSRRKKQPGDPDYPNPEQGFDDNAPPSDHEEWDDEIEQPLAFEDFKHSIDTRGGYLQEVVESTEAANNEQPDLRKTIPKTELPDLATAVEQFHMDCDQACEERQVVDAALKKAYDEEGLTMPQFLMSQIQEEEKLLPDTDFKYDPSKREPYPETHRTQAGLLQDERLGLVKEWLKDTTKRPAGFPNKKYRRFIKFAKQFFVDSKDRLYKRGVDSQHKLVVEKDHRMYMMKASHDSLGHKGIYSTKSLIEVRFWWPEMDRDIDWFIKSCRLCQIRQKKLLKIPPVATMTPSLFQKIHIDVMIMGVVSNQYRLVVAARDSLTRWLEARAIRNDNGETLGRFLLEEIICRWGCPKWIVTDNAGQFIAAVKWLNAKYGITGIRISAYNSQANGPVETGHWDMRQSMYKATGGDTRKWYWFLPQVIWADRITTRRGLGCTPYFAVTGAHPIIPLDIEEATWLVEYPDKIISTAELVGLRAKALAKHIQHIEEMRERVSAEKLAAVRRYERVHEATIENYDFQPGDLVLVRNTTVEKSLNTKMSPRYLGPMVVVRRTKGGSYLCCEMNGAMFRGKIAQFRVVPFEARKRIKLSRKIEELIDMSSEKLGELAEGSSQPDEYLGKDIQFHNVTLRPDWEQVDPNELSDEYVSDEEPEDDSLEPTPSYDTSNPRRSKRVARG